MVILVTGATGYIGGRLVPDLLEAGHQVRVLVRDAERIRGREWHGQVDIVVGDLLTSDNLDSLFQDVDVAYYLIHSMQSGDDYASMDAQLAERFARLGKASRLRHVIYLGGLLPKGKNVSKHLRSRAIVGKILAKHLPTTEFRAGPIIGSGSASFEMVRYLTERLPVMITPRWITNEVAPIAVRDVLAYLQAGLEKPPCGVVPIGAPPLTFGDMMETFAEERGLRRFIQPIPVLTPWLAARWIGFVTPLSNRLAIPLVKSIVLPILADTRKAEKLFPSIQPISYREAVQRALERIRLGNIETRWSGALGIGPTYQLTDTEGMVREERSLSLDLTPEEVARSFMTIGGERGWLVWRWAWAIRGAMDILIGGPGLRRGRRDPEKLLPGEPVDFWRVEVVEPPKLLRLRAEMKVPGKAWLQWETFKEADGKTRLVQTAIFAPKGLLGFAYWYALYPIHRFIFSDMIEAIAADAYRLAGVDLRRLKKKLKAERPGHGTGASPVVRK